MKDVSRLLSAALRHKPNILGLELDKNGWVTIGRLLDQLEVYGHECDYEELLKIVETNGKKRFEIKKTDGNNGYDDLIRACQGHSVKVDLQLKREKPPSFLYHGSVRDSIDKIMVTGMKKMSRHAIHLSVDTETAIQVGSRRGKPILLKISAGVMHMDGFKFYQSTNGVWLTEDVPAKYIKEL